MAEERNVGLARATELPGEDDANDTTKAELQRRMEEARESITQTVTEIKDTVTQQYQQVKDTISDTLDWREQYRRRPLPFTAGALVGGALLGYCVAGAFKGDGDEEDEDDGAFDRIEAGFDQMQGASRAYAATPITGAPSHASAAYQSPSPRPASADATMDFASRQGADVGPDTRPSYSSGYEAATAAETAEEAGPKGPGLMQRFKETKAYDRLQDELSTLGERAVEELSRTATSVIVPALLSKLKDLIGIDLSTQREVAKRSQLEHQTAKSTAGTSAAATEGQAASAAQGARGGL
ncbi:MAG: hypothetical protein LC802_18855 [Acidobacteria bacterium]|nr:hypothetical protein [Acidobacteriota bacterium]